MSTTYVSLGLSDDGSTLVDEFVLSPSQRWQQALLLPLATFTTHPRALLDEWLGALILLRLTMIFDDTCARYGLRLSRARIQELGQRLPDIALGSLPTRPEHVRLFIDTGPDRLLVTRERPTGTSAAASLLLAELALSGRDTAARTVGQCALDQLAALHPGAFSW